MKKKSNKKRKPLVKTKQLSPKTDRKDRVVEYEEDSCIDYCVKHMNILQYPAKAAFGLSFIEMSGAKLLQTPWGFLGKTRENKMTYFVDKGASPGNKFLYTRNPQETLIGIPTSFGGIRVPLEAERRKLDILDISVASELIDKMFDPDVCRTLGTRWLTTRPISITPNNIDPDAYTAESRETYRYLRELSRDPSSSVKRTKYDKCESFSCLEIGIPFIFDKIELKFWENDSGFLVLEDDGDEWSITLYMNEMQVVTTTGLVKTCPGVAWRYKSKKRVVSFDLFCYNKNIINSIFTDSTGYYYNGSQYLSMTAWTAMIEKRLEKYSEVKERRDILTGTGVFGAADLEVLEDPMLSPADDCFAMYSMLALDAVSVVMSYAIVANYIVSCRVAASRLRQEHRAKLERIQNKVLKAQKIAEREGISTDEVLQDERWKSLTPKEQKILEDAQLRTAERLAAMGEGELEELAIRDDGIEALNDSRVDGRILRVVNISPPMQKAIKKHSHYTKRKEAEYTTAAWGCIGHFRVTKTGKRVWVNPSIRHRQKPLTYSETARTLYRPTIRSSEEL